MLSSIFLTFWLASLETQTPPASPPSAEARATTSPDTAAPRGKARAVAAASEGEAPDDSEVSKQVEQESLELEEMRAAEQANLAPGAQRDADLLRAARRLGVANPLRQRLSDALLDPGLQEDAARGELLRISDLSAFDPSVLKDEYDIPLAMQPLVADYIRFFQGPGRKWFRAWMGRSTRYIPVMQPLLAEAGLPKDTVYLAMIESGFSAHAYSWAHAAGPWQFISSTGKLYGLKQDFWIDERRDPIKSTRAAARFLKDLHDELGDWFLAWAGYNAGGGKVRRMIGKKGSRDFWELSEGRGFATETKHYVPKLIAAALVAKHPKAFGFDDAEFEFLSPLEYDEVKVPAPTDLEVIARMVGADLSEIVDLNPELKRWCTPPASEQKPYLLRVPKGTARAFEEGFAKIAPQERLTFAVHRVKRGDTISTIAVAYHSAPEAIMQLNRLRNARALRVNTELIIPVPSRGRGKVANATLDRQVARARRSGFVAHRPEEEIPAGTASKPVASGPVKTATVNGRTRLTYVVQRGDSLWAIGQRFNCSVDDLRKWNSLSRRARRLSIGASLYIWPPAGAVQVQGGTVIAEKPGHKTVHQLAAGETLWSVARRYNVSVEDIKRWNGISQHRNLAVGTAITVMLP